MTCNLNFIKTEKIQGIDWNYLTTDPCLFVFDMSHSQIPIGFQNKWLNIDKTFTEDGHETITVTIAKDYAWDGASGVPDYAGTLEASMPHDGIYQFSEDIAKAWGWSVWKVLGFADTLFNLVMAYYKVNPFLRHTYYAGVVIIGYPFHQCAKLWRWITNR